jgi:AbrB family looped-hinge helix DNA binding protein
MKNQTIRIDKAGRVVLPKPLREQFNLVPGDRLRVLVEGNSLRLEPTEGEGKLGKEGSVLVFTGGFAEKITTARIEEMIRQEREERILTGLGKLRKK